MSKIRTAETVRTIEKLYFEQSLTAPQIALKIGCHPNTVYLALNEGPANRAARRREKIDNRKRGKR